MLMSEVGDRKGKLPQFLWIYFYIIKKPIFSNVKNLI